MSKYSGAILLSENESLHGEPEEAIRAAEEAGIIRYCKGGKECAETWWQHKGDGFWHLCEGRTMSDYDRCVGIGTDA